MRKFAVLAAVVLCIGVPMLLVELDAVAYYSATRNSGAVVLPSGESRDYLLHIPHGYTGSTAVPLVISLHGAMNWPALQMIVTRWNESADEHGFIAAYPAGDGGGPATWSETDVGSISRLIDQLSASYRIDPKRIYVNGLSNGGGMSHAIGCTIPDRVAAIGAVAAAITFPYQWCPSPKPVPLIAFHGTADRITPYHGGKVWIAPSPFPDIPMWASTWAAKNGCAPAPSTSAVASGVTRLDYRTCDAGADVTLYTIEGGGHSWPGGVELPAWATGPTSNAVDATKLMWEFFAAHPLSR
jgi:polyhydroxybutyrate depolymerase